MQWHSSAVGVHKGRLRAIKFTGPLLPLAHATDTSPLACIAFEQAQWPLSAGRGTASAKIIRTELAISNAQRINLAEVIDLGPEIYYR